jgi:hypothetical protein
MAQVNLGDLTAPLTVAITLLMTVKPKAIVRDVIKGVREST